MLFKVANLCELVQLSQILGDCVVVSLVPSMELKSFSDHRWFRFQVILHNLDWLTVCFIGCLRWCQEILQQAIRFVPDNRLKHSDFLRVVSYSIYHEELI